MMNQLGNYNEILENFGSTEHKQELASGIKKYVTTGEITSSITERDKTTIIDTSHLLFGIEVIRNRTTMFTAPMFIDKMIATGEVTARDFPMSMEGAVDAARDIRETYKDKLQNTRGPDYGKPSVNEGNELLDAEGEALAAWLNNQGQPELDNAIKLINSRKHICDLSISEEINNNKFVKTMNALETIQDQFTLEQKQELEPSFTELTKHKNALRPNRRGLLDEGRKKQFNEFAGTLIPILDKKITSLVSKEIIVDAIGALNTKIVSGYYAMNPEKVLNTQFHESSISASVAIASDLKNDFKDLEGPIKKRKKDKAPAAVIDSLDDKTIFHDIKNIPQATSRLEEEKVIADRMVLGFEAIKSSITTNAIKPSSRPKVPAHTKEEGPAI